MPSRRIQRYESPRPDQLAELRASRPTAERATTNVGRCPDRVEGASRSTSTMVWTENEPVAGALQAYLRQAVLNKLRDELRKHGRQPEILTLDDTGSAAI